MILAEQLASYAQSLSYADLPPGVIAVVKQRLVDSLACILGAYDAAPVAAGRALAAAVAVPASTVFGGSTRTTPDIAAFVNGTMVRYLDYNDGYMSKEPGHPSDNITALLAVAEAEGASGESLITAIVIAYEVQMRLQDAAGLNKRGWDHVNFVLIAVAVAASRLMGLTRSQTTQAINMSVNGHVALRQVRSGELSSWKGVSAANAARNAIFCATLARHGMTGPSPIFEGKMGFMVQLSGDFDLDVATWGMGANLDFMILKSLTKLYPTNGEMHTAVFAALKLRPRIPGIAAISAIHIDTTDIGFRILASDRQKWRPLTRETADHSLPYTTCRALMDGDITLKSYEPEAIADPRVVALMDRVTVREASALTALFPRSLPNSVTVTLTTGEVLTETVVSMPGTLEMPMTDAQFEAKFRAMAAPYLNAMSQDGALSFVRTLEKQVNFEPLFAAMRRSG